MDKYKFGNRLCSLREEKGLSQKDLARILDVSDKAISKWENGQSIPRMDTLEKLAKVFHVGIDVLLNDDETEIERRRVKKSIFQDEQNRYKRVFMTFGLGGIVLTALVCLFDAIVYFCFGNSDLADLLLQNVKLLSLPIGILTVYAFVNSWLLRLIAGLKNHFSDGDFVVTANEVHAGFGVLNGISCILSLMPFLLALFSDAEYSLIGYVIIYFVSVVLLTVNLLTSDYANTSVFFTENGIFDKSIDYGDFYPYSKLTDLESNLEDIHSAKTDTLKIRFSVEEKEYKVSINEDDIGTVCLYLNLKYSKKLVEQNTEKPSALFIAVRVFCYGIMAFGMILFLSNSQFGTKTVDYTKRSEQFIGLDGETFVAEYQDKLYAFTEQNCAVDVFDKNGTFLYANRVPRAQNGQSQYYLYRDSLYIADRDYSLYRYDLNGNFLGRITADYIKDDAVTVSKYDKNDNKILSYDVPSDVVYPIFFDDDTEKFSADEKILTYRRKTVVQSEENDFLFYFGDYIDGALYDDDDADGVWYFTRFGSLCVSTEDEFVTLYPVSFFSWYRHSVFACWATAAFGGLLSFLA